jgi:hypothetical protein
VDVVLYGASYWEDYELWACLKGLKEDKYIKAVKIFVGTEWEERFWLEILRKVF